MNNSSERNAGKKPENQTPPGKIEDLLDLPASLQEFTNELRRLNDNTPAILDEARRLRKVLEDLRKMTAPLLGFRVEEDKKEKNKPRS